MKKPYYSEKEKMIQAERLKTIMEEKDVRQVDILKYLDLHAFSDYETKLPKYIRGQLSIPRDIAPLIADYLNIDVGFLTDKDTFNDSLFTGDYSYAGYLRLKNFENLSSDDFYKKYSAILSIFGFKLGVYDDGTYGIYEGNAITLDCCLRLSREELFALVEEMKASGSILIRSRMKGGGTDDLK